MHTLLNTLARTSTYLSDVWKNGFTSKGTCVYTHPTRVPSYETKVCDVHTTPNGITVITAADLKILRELISNNILIHAILENHCKISGIAVWSRGREIYVVNEELVKAGAYDGVFSLYTEDHVHFEVSIDDCVVGELTCKVAGLSTEVTVNLVMHTAIRGQFDSALNTLLGNTYLRYTNAFRERIIAMQLYKPDDNAHVTLHEGTVLGHTRYFSYMGQVWSYRTMAEFESISLSMLMPFCTMITIAGKIEPAVKIGNHVFYRGGKRELLDTNLEDIIKQVYR